jgi:hypothetical protein
MALRGPRSCSTLRVAEPANPRDQKDGSAATLTVIAECAWSSPRDVHGERTRSQACRARRKLRVFYAGLRRGMTVWQGAPGLHCNANLPREETQDVCSHEREENQTDDDVDVSHDHEEDQVDEEGDAECLLAVSNRSMEPAGDHHSDMTGNEKESNMQDETLEEVTAAGSSEGVDRTIDHDDTQETLISYILGWMGDGGSKRSEFKKFVSVMARSGRFPQDVQPEIDESMLSDSSVSQGPAGLMFPGLSFSTDEDAAQLIAVSRHHRECIERLQNEEVQRQLDQRHLPSIT